ncbi:MAG: hypothetical protein D6695_02870 [Planctomycetota bacterium]|nr:MAG: hypothetical protein D6695_02870 [Planctomycetota bacterium]
MIRTLWDLLNRPAAKPAPVREPRRKSGQSPAAERYLRMQREMLSRYGVRVRKWRSAMSGVAWQVRYHDGSTAKLIEAPRPKGPVSASVFLHEIGHHAIGFGTYRPRCLEELHAWCFALDQMDAWNITITQNVRKRVHLSLAYAIEKAQRRGLRCLPDELRPFVNLPTQEACWVDPRESVARGPS